VLYLKQVYGCVLAVAYLEDKVFFWIYGSIRLRPSIFWLVTHALVIFHVYCQLLIKLATGALTNLSLSYVILC